MEGLPAGPRVAGGERDLNHLPRAAGVAASQVGLEIVSQDTDGRSLVLRGPPNINIAPPGWYMLFLLNGDTYGQSAWVRLPGSAPKLDSFLSTLS